jgi:uncharacterized protein (TIGR03067 family)
MILKDRELGLLFAVGLLFGSLAPAVLMQTADAGAREAAVTDGDAGPSSAVRFHIDLDNAQGAWDVVRHASRGTGFGNLDGSGEPLGPRVVISGNNISLRFRPGDPLDKPSEYLIKRIDDGTGPKQIDITLSTDGQPVIQKGIYLLQQDLIKCEFASPGQPRPANFEAANQNDGPTNLLILRRVKKK